MKREIDIEVLLKPISKESPSGDNLRYTVIYEQIKEARRFDDPVEQGDWKTNLKTADWDKVISIATEALSKRTKDLQIAVWFTEALAMADGFTHLAGGLTLTAGLIERFWDSLYPGIEDDDIEYRIAPLEFLNERLNIALRQIPVTEPGKTVGYSWLQWKESREVGYEADTRNKHGNLDESRKQRRDEQIEEGKLRAEDFDAAAAVSSPEFYAELAGHLLASSEAFALLDKTVDDKFGRDTPRLAELAASIEECTQLVTRLAKEKRTVEKSVESKKHVDNRKSSEIPNEKGVVLINTSKKDLSHNETDPQKISPMAPAGSELGAVSTVLSDTMPDPLSDESLWERKLWDDAVRTVEDSGTKKALEKLLTASLSAPSIRQRNRYRLLVAKLCLNAGRPDLARPILEELNTLVEKLQLEQWESPVWIAEVIGSLYRCITSGEPSQDDLLRSQTIFQKLCTIDITKAVNYEK